MTRIEWNTCKASFVYCQVAGDRRPPGRDMYVQHTGFPLSTGQIILSRWDGSYSARFRLASLRQSPGLRSPNREAMPVPPNRLIELKLLFSNFPVIVQRLTDLPDDRRKYSLHEFGARGLERSLGVCGEPDDEEHQH